MAEGHPDHARIKRYREKASEAAQYAAQCRDDSMLEGCAPGFAGQFLGTTGSPGGQDRRQRDAAVRMFAAEVTAQLLSSNTRLVQGPV